MYKYFMQVVCCTIRAYKIIIDLHDQNFIFRFGYINVTEQKYAVLCR